MDFKIPRYGDPDFKQYWNVGTTLTSDPHVFYSDIIRSFDHAYFGEDGIADHSFVLLDQKNDSIQALVPLYLFQLESGRIFGYSGFYQVAPLVFAREGTRQHQDAIDKCFSVIADLAKEYEVTSHRAYYPCPTVVRGAYFSNPLTSFGYADESCTGLVLGLYPDESTLWKNLRKSYKPLINRALKSTEIILLDQSNYDFSLCEEYRKLHFVAAGRETRHKASFYAQYQLVQDGYGYIVFVQMNGIFVGAYFFYQMNGYVFYASAATIPECHPQSGVGHLGVWKGIQNAKALGARYFDFGMLEENPSDQKVQNIQFFKLGFGGRRVITFRGTKTFQVGA
jgi:hypothetical protein